MSGKATTKLRLAGTGTPTKCGLSAECLAWRGWSLTCREPEVSVGQLAQEVVRGVEHLLSCRESAAGTFIVWIWETEGPEGDLSRAAAVTAAEWVEGDEEALTAAWETVPAVLEMAETSPVLVAAQPSHVIRDGAVWTVTRSDEAFEKAADVHRAKRWKNLELLEARAGGRSLWGEALTRQLGAESFLRTFLQERKVFQYLEFPALDNPGAPCPDWMQRYLDRDAHDCFHVSNSVLDHATCYFLAADNWLPLRACPLAASFRHDPRDNTFVHELTFQPTDGTPERSASFVYRLLDRGHLERLTQLAAQRDLALYFVQPDEEGTLRFQGGRLLQLPAETAADFVLQAARLVAGYEGRAQIPAVADLAAAGDSPEEQLAAAVEALERREARVWAVRELCRLQALEHIEPLLEAVRKMTWMEIDQVWEVLPQLGEQAVEGLQQLACSPKKSAAAAAMRALGRLPHPGALAALVTLLIERPSKGEPAEALVDLGQYAVPQLLELTRHRKAEVREVAAYALGKIGAEEALDRLYEMLTDDRSTKVQDMAESAVAWIEGNEECETDLRAWR